MPEYPSGTVAFLFTDIEGSTRRWETQQQAMWIAVERHFALMRAAIEAQQGVLFKTIGDAVQGAFPTIPLAIAAAVAAQAALRQEDWGDLGPMRVRMAVHVGAATPRDGDYLAPALNRLARVLSSGYGEQILLTEAARAAAGTDLPSGCDVLDLGAHRLRDLLQAEHIFQLRGPGLVADFPPLKNLDRHLHNLPAQPTALLGRETEIAAVRALLEQDEVRLVTLTGPGGTGKTRLGVQVAAELAEAFADGVWFIPLAAVADPDLVVAAIAQPLGVREVAGEPLLESVQDYLRSRHALLLLDNFEHVTAAAPDVAAILASCPHVKVLATSREPLRIRGEREFPVSPLALPQPRQVRNISPTALLDFPAIRLFVERAQAVKPDFALTAANASDVASIAQRLDGLPLAIELAAARARILPPAKLLARLDKRLKLLTGGSRDLPARQQTLRAAIEWSHDLLRPDDQALFARLAVFVGGCTLEAAEAVCADVGEHTLAVLDGLESLVLKSLVRQDGDADGTLRFTMLETIREYGLERLEATGEVGAVRRAHAAYFLALSEEAEPELRGAEQVTWLDRLGAEHDNLRAALGSLEQPADAETRLRLAGSLWRFWWVRGHLTEGRGWLERALNSSANMPPAIQAKALNGAGILAESQGDYEQATTLHEQALELRRQAGDRQGVAASLTNLGIIASIQGNYRRAAELHKQSLALWQELGDEPGIASALYELGSLTLNRGNYGRARTLLQQSFNLFRDLGDVPGQAIVLESLGIHAFHNGDYEGAASHYEKGLELWRNLEDSRMIAHSLSNLGEAMYNQGDHSRANSLLNEALLLYKELGETRGKAFVLYQLGILAAARDDASQAALLFGESVALRQQLGEDPAIIESLEGLASVACLRGESTRAIRLFAASEAQRGAIGAPLPPAYQAKHQRHLDSARAAIGETEFAAAWAAGRELSLDEAIAEALPLTRGPSVCIKAGG
ncbi:MAG: ATP-binding protein [Thermomicrobiales bacterium]